MFRFVELPENNQKHLDEKAKVKFKIMSLKVKEDIDYVPELVRMCSNARDLFVLARRYRVLLSLLCVFFCILNVCSLMNKRMKL